MVTVKKNAFRILRAKLELMSAGSNEKGGDACLCGQGCGNEHPLNLMKEVLGDKMAHLIGGIGQSKFGDGKNMDYIGFEPDFCVRLEKVVQLLDAFVKNKFIELE